MTARDLTDASSTPPGEVEKITRILIVDDHPVFRRGLISLLNGQDDFMICGEAGGFPEALESMRRLVPDVAVVDVALPGRDGLDLVRAMLAERPEIKILVVSMHDEPLRVLDALQAGAGGYVIKTDASDHVVRALRQVIRGHLYMSPQFGKRMVFRAMLHGDSKGASLLKRLTEREREVLRLTGRGLGTRETASTMKMSMKMVQSHRAHIMSKLHLETLEEVKNFAVEWVSAQRVG